MSRNFGLFRVVAVGDAFDVDGFLAATGLPIDRCWHKGDLRSECAEIESRFRNSGFLLRLGDECVLDFREQCDVAFRFLSRHRDPLEMLKGWPGLESSSIQLSPEIEVRPGRIAAGLSFPRRLVSLAGELGFSLGVNVRVKPAADGVSA